MRRLSHRGGSAARAQSGRGNASGRFRMLSRCVGNKHDTCSVMPTALRADTRNRSGAKSTGAATKPSAVLRRKSTEKMTPGISTSSYSRSGRSGKCGHLRHGRATMGRSIDKTGGGESQRRGHLPQSRRPCPCIERHRAGAHGSIRGGTDHSTGGQIAGGSTTCCGIRRSSSMGVCGKMADVRLSIAWDMSASTPSNSVVMTCADQAVLGPHRQCRGTRETTRHASSALHHAGLRSARRAGVESIYENACDDHVTEPREQRDHQRFAPGLPRIFLAEPAATYAICPRADAKYHTNR